MAAARARRGGGEGGYVLIFFSLLLIVLMAFTGFGVDLGSWYSKGYQMQRAADAAALAGVVHLPNDWAGARATALDAAKRNGFEDGGTVSITVEQRGPRKLAVTITDTEVKSHFIRPFLDHIRMARTGVAEYVLPVPMGSPKNHLGTGPLMGPPKPEDFWLAVSGYCTSREDGDLILSRYMANRDANNGTIYCPPASPPLTWVPSFANPYYDPQGYFYDVDFSVTPSEAVVIEVYDAGFMPAYRSGSSLYCNSVETPDSLLAVLNWSAPNCGLSITTTYNLTSATATPLDNSDDPVLATATVDNSNAATYRNQWRPIGTITNPQAGRYRLQVTTLAGETTSYGSNGFAIRARFASQAPASFTACTTVVGASGYRPDCPQVHGENHMGVFANLSGASSEFYLAQVDQVHAGKKVEITLFDPGEGSQMLQILEPGSNSPVRFDWVADPCDNLSTCSGTGVMNLATHSTGQKVGPNRYSDYNFSDRKIKITLQLPPDYDPPEGGWWRVKYVVGSAPTDRTTWSVVVTGDPVHLVHEK